MRNYFEWEEDYIFIFSKPQLRFQSILFPFAKLFYVLSLLLFPLITPERVTVGHCRLVNLGLGTPTQIQPVFKLVDLFCPELNYSKTFVVTGIQILLLKYLLIKSKDLGIARNILKKSQSRLKDRKSILLPPPQF